MMIKDAMLQYLDSKDLSLSVVPINETASEIRHGRKDVYLYARIDGSDYLARLDLGFRDERFDYQYTVSSRARHYSTFVHAAAAEYAGEFYRLVKNPADAFRRKFILQVDAEYLQRVLVRERDLFYSILAELVKNDLLDALLCGAAIAAGKELGDNSVSDNISKIRRTVAAARMLG